MTRQDVISNVAAMGVGQKYINLVWFLTDNHSHSHSESIVGD